MGFIAEFTISSPVMRETTHEVPEMVFRTEDFITRDNDTSKYVFWANGGDFERLERSLSEDRSVQSFSLLTEEGGRRLYRTSLVDDEEMLTYDRASELDIVFLNVEMMDGRSDIRVFVPTREALQKYKQYCQEKDIPFQLKKVYNEARGLHQERYGLTDPQYEALITAFEGGYFGDTRMTTLEGLSDELGITRQALAARLRRGHERLIKATLMQTAPEEITGI